LTALNRLTPPINTWVCSTLGADARLLHARELKGSSSATLYRITLLRRGQIVRCVLRLFTNREWLAVEPDIPEHEAAALEKVSSAGLPVPQMLAVDPRGADCGLPALLMSEVPGRVDLLPANIESWLRQQAEFLVRLHALEPADFKWRYRPYFKPAELAVPAWTAQPQLWQKAIEIINSPAPDAPLRFIHRDYHPLNVLWRKGRLSGAVDWVNACLGPAGVDVGWMRHNLAAMYGVPMADRWLAVCCEVMGTTFAYHPYWDLITFLEILPGPIEVYAPWTDFGLSHLTPALVAERDEAYLASLLRRF
jgi:aminoglycoside phosphotransferase (APT) family kinase protein